MHCERCGVEAATLNERRGQFVCELCARTYFLQTPEVALEILELLQWAITDGAVDVRVLNSVEVYGSVNSYER